MHPFRAIKHSNLPTGMFWGGWSKPKTPEEIHTDMGRTCTETLRSQKPDLQIKLETLDM